MTDAQAQAIAHSLRVFLSMPRQISDAKALAHIEDIAAIRDEGTKAILMAIESD